MTVKLADVLDVIRDFADTEPEQVDWEMISDMVDMFLNDYESTQYSYHEACFPADTDDYWAEENY
jgi:hypothetical protein